MPKLFLDRADRMTSLNFSLCDIHSLAFFFFFLKLFLHLLYFVCPAFKHFK